MSNGAVIIANNTKEIEYTRLARIAARLVNKNLGIPVTLVTNTPSNFSEFENTIVVNNNKNNKRSFVIDGNNQTIDWYNLDRADIFDITPYDRTLLIDADMFVLTDALKSHLEGTFDFGIVTNIHNPVTGNVLVESLTQNRPIDLCWATAVIFNKNEKAGAIFNLTKHIIKHYDTYAKIYDFDSKPIRNDFAFSIAVHLMSGYGLGNLGLKNYSLTTVNFNNKIYKIKPNNKFVISYEKNDRIYIQQLGLSDVHFLNKIDLMKNINELELL